jgi:hypothetical protein
VTARRYEPYDLVRLAVDLPDEGLHAGAIGTVLEVFTDPTLAYKVEFADCNGQTLAELALCPSQLDSAA